jgi:Leucine-rich repeat (LRR) protein
MPLHSLIGRPAHFDRDTSPEEQEYRPLQADISLDFAQNALYALPLELFNLQNITALCLRDNNLTVLSPHISKLQNLVRLDISGNRLRWLPWELLDLVRTGVLSKLEAHSNPLYQPFTYLGPWYKSWTSHWLQDELHPPFEAWNSTPTMTELFKRLKWADETLTCLEGAKLRRSTLQEVDGYDDDQRTLEQAIEQATWMRHFYVTYVAELMNTIRNDVCWGDGDDAKERIRALASERGLRLTDVWEQAWEEAREAELENAPETLQEYGWAIRLASTPVSRFEINGFPALSQQYTAPSLIPQDSLILPAVLGKNAFDFSKEDHNLHKPIKSLLNRGSGLKSPRKDEIPQGNNATPSSLQTTESSVPSLFDLCLQSATRVSQHELTELSTLIPDDPPPSVIHGLDTAVAAREEGGRICSVCKRSYVISRTEWVEYWHILTSELNFVRKENIFLPFLRRGCSLKCLPTNSEHELSERLIAAIW